MPKSLFPDSLHDLIHLEEEELIMAVHGEALPDALQHHLDHCQLCQRRLEDARDALAVEPLHRDVDPFRRDRLMDVLTQAGVVEPASARQGRVHLVFEGSAVRILETDAQVHIGPSMATRHAGDGREPMPAGVTFFRQLGRVGVELHLVRVAHGNFHLVVGVADAEQQEGLRIVLRRGSRELAAEPVPTGTTTFKDLSPSRGPYALELQRHGLRIGTIDLDVSVKRTHDDEVEG